LIETDATNMIRDSHLPYHSINEVRLVADEIMRSRSTLESQSNSSQADNERIKQYEQQLDQMQRAIRKADQSHRIYALFRQYQLSEHIVTRSQLNEEMQRLQQRMQRWRDDSNNNVPVASISSMMREEMDVGLQREWEKMLIVRDEVNKVCYYRQKKTNYTIKNV
jgi:cell division FtsZ-interacting protein ZapD